MFRRCMIILLLAFGIAHASISFSPGINADDVIFNTILIGEETYATIMIDGILTERISTELGSPVIPAIYRKYILPPSQKISNITLTNETWETLSGNHIIAPLQNYIDLDAGPVSPLDLVYNSVEAFPEATVTVTSQSSLSGFGVATIRIAPIRYFPAEGRLEVLTSADVSIEYSSSQFESVVPLRSSVFAAERRLASVAASVSNPEDIDLYSSVPTTEHDGCEPLYITSEPSIYGDAVDFVIITTDEFAGDLSGIAEHRTAQGIVTVIRTVDWINSTYTGCDTPQRIRNFIKDAYEKWGIQFVLLGGEEEDVPTRLVSVGCAINETTNVPYEAYYGDIDGCWIDSQNGWENFLAGDGELVEISVGRLPLNSGSDDFMNFYLKLFEYENPTIADGDEAYLKKICSFTLFELDDEDLIDPDWAATTKFVYGEWFESNSDWMAASGGPVEEYYNLYTPRTFSYLGDEYIGDAELNRGNALDALNDSLLNSSANIFIHTDHSGIHNLGMGTSIQGPNKIFDNDFYNLENHGHPFIFYSSCCWPGHFNGAESILEHSLFASPTSGAVASIGAPISNSHFAGVYYFIDAFYPFLSNIDPQKFNDFPPFYFVGEGWKHKMNISTLPHYEILFGDPTMVVWRDMPDELVVAGLPTTATAGTPFSTQITVTDGTSVVEGAKVVLWLEEELFTSDITNSSGIATFTNLYSATCGDVKVTALKYSDSSEDICNYIIERTFFSIGNSTEPILSVESLEVDDSGTSTDDGNFNPGETVYLDLEIENTGGDETRNITATLTAVTSGFLDVTILDGSASISRIYKGQTVSVDNAFQVSLPANFDTSEPIEFTTTFTCPEGSWSSLVYMYAASGDIQIPVSDLSVDVGTLGSIGISIDRMVLCNSGIGDVSGISVTASNFVPAHSRISGTLTASISSIEAQGGAEADEVIDFTLLNLLNGNQWLDSDMPGCSFDLTVTDAAGNTYTTKGMDMEDWANALNNLDPFETCPYDLLLNEATTATAEVEWSQDQLPNDPLRQGLINPAYFIFGYMIYKRNSSNNWELASYYPSPVPQWIFTDLSALTEYEVCATVVDNLGRESSMSDSFPFTTTCPQQHSWPVQLTGNIGSGLLLANVDGTTGDEIVAVTDCGNLYIQTAGQSAWMFNNPEISEPLIWFTGCASADVNDDGNVDIVASGISNMSNGEVCICLIEETSNNNWEITTTYWTDFGWKIHENTGVPVIFQADATDELEIAFRVYNSWYGDDQDTELHVLKYNPITEYLETYSAGYPVPVGDGNNTLVYTPPVLLEDYDNDGNVELALTCQKIDGFSDSPAVAIIDIVASPSPEYFNIPLPPKDGNNWMIRSTLASVTYDAETYVTGIISYHYSGSSLDDRQLFILNASSEEFVSVAGGVILDVPMFDWSDQFSGGPCIGYVDTDAKPDILVAMDNLYAWDLSGSMKVLDGELEEDTDVYTGGSLSAPSIAGVQNGANVAFTGYSSRTYGHSLTDSSVLPGFPYYTEEKISSTPIILDCDGDGDIEVLNGNRSGLISILDWTETLEVGLSWPMYQHDPQRTGYWNHVSRGNGLDIEVRGVAPLQTADVSGSTRGQLVEVTVVVTGAEATSPAVTSTSIERVSECSPHTAPVGASNSSSGTSCSIAPPSVNNETVVLESSTAFAELAIVDRNSRFSSLKRFPLVNGTHLVRIMLPGNVEQYTVIADPSNEYAERSESNNHFDAQVSVDSFAGICITSLSNPTYNSVTLTLSIGENVSGDVSISVYSLAGRVVSSRILSDVTPGSYQLELRGSSDEMLPAGAYIVRVEAFGFDESRSMIVLSR